MGPANRPYQKGGGVPVERPKSMEVSETNSIRNIARKRRTITELIRFQELGSAPLSAPHSAATTFAPPPSTRPFRTASLPTPTKPRMAPSRVPWDFAGEMSARRRVFIMRGESEGYVVECWVRSLESVCEAVVRSCVAWLGGSDECRRIERMGGRIWCSYR